MFMRSTSHAAPRRWASSIFGCETYVSPTTRFDKTKRKNNHLILLARDSRVIRTSRTWSRAHLEGFYYNPRIDKELLRERRRSHRHVGLRHRRRAGAGGHEGRADRRARGGSRISRSLRAGCYFFEVQPNGMQEQEQVNAEPFRSRAAGIGLVATNDCHYVADDARAHEVLMCIQTGKDSHRRAPDAPPRRRLLLEEPGGDAAVLRDMPLPEALANTARIASDVQRRADIRASTLPLYEVPEGHDARVQLERPRAPRPRRPAARDACARAASRSRPVPRAAGALSLEMICKMGFPGTS